MKANYSRGNGEIPLIWRNGVFIREGDDGGIVSSIEAGIAARVFLKLLVAADRAGRPVSDRTTASNYAPRVFVRSPDREGVRVRDFERAMESLFAQQTIKMVPYGPGNRSHKIVLREE